MGFFDKPDSTPRSGNAPLTRERIEAVLSGQDWRYYVDSDGDVGGLWDDNPFYFFMMGDDQEVLQIRGRWKHKLSPSLRGRVLEFADDFHRDRIWPKVYTRIDDDGTEMSVQTEVSTDCEHGVADDQLELLVRCGLITGLRFFDALGEHLQISIPGAE